MINLFGTNGLFVVIAIPQTGRGMEHTPLVAQIEAENGYTALKRWLKGSGREHLTVSKYIKKKNSEVFQLSGPRKLTDFGLGDFIEPIDIVAEV